MLSQNAVVKHNSLNALPQYLSADLERLQKRALRIIFPGLSYKEALNASNLPTLKERMELLTTTLFKEAVENKSHKLNKLLQPSPSFEKNCFSAWASTLNMGLINNVDMVCLWPVGYGV